MAIAITMADEDEESAVSDSGFNFDYSLIDLENDDEDEFRTDGNSVIFSDHSSLDVHDDFCKFMWPTPMDRESMVLECRYAGVRELKFDPKLMQSRSHLIYDAGKVIGDSLSLKMIDITIPVSANVGIDELFQGISRNRSIELIQLRLTCCEPDLDIFQALIPFFEHNQNLRCIELFRARSWTLNLLSSALSKCKKISQLMRISLIEPKVTDKSMAAFFDSLNNNNINTHSIPELCLQIMPLGTMGGEALAKLLNNNSPFYMKSLYVFFNNDKDVLCLGKALALNTALEFLHINVNDEYISSEGWQELSKCLSNPKSALKTLILEKIDNDDVFYLGEALACNKALTRLDIYISAINHTISLDGWRGFSKCLRNPQSALRHLSITSYMENQDIYEIVRALKDNSCLEYLDIDLANSIVVHKRLWRVLSRLLCDKRSIAHTFSSNHSLCRFAIDRCDSAAEEYDADYDDISHNTEVPRYIEDWLSMNENEDKSEVAREKILKQHFSGGNTNSYNVFACMPVSVLVYGIEWMGRNNLGYSLMNDFVRGFPELFDVRGGQQQDAVGMKRKR